MNKVEAVKRLVYKMRRECKNCISDYEVCFNCWVYYFSNLMLEEVNGE